MFRLFWTMLVFFVHRSHACFWMKKTRVLQETRSKSGAPQVSVLGQIYCWLSTISRITSMCLSPTTSRRSPHSHKMAVCRAPSIMFVSYKKTGASLINPIKLHAHGFLVKHNLQLSNSCRFYTDCKFCGLSH